MTRTADQMQPINTPLWRPRSWEAKARVYRSWFLLVGLDLGIWAIGFGFDVAPTGFEITLGPLFVGTDREEPPPDSYDDLPDWSRTLRRIVIEKWKLEIRFEFDLNIWRLGYLMADLHDHGLYFGPFNLQIEYDKMYKYPTIAREPRLSPHSPDRTSILSARSLILI